MTGLAKAISRSRAVVNSAHTRALQMKQDGTLESSLIPSHHSMFGGMHNRGADRDRYSQFRGWLYAAVNAIAKESARQQVRVGKLVGAAPRNEEDERGRRLREKSAFFAKRAASSRVKSAATEIEILLDHPLLDTLEQPNPAQNRFQFVYSFVANLNITGWSFVVAEFVGGKLHLYSLPTTWVRPIHKNGLFAQFRVVNPNDLNAASNDDKDLFDRSQVAFAHMPNPSNLLAAMAPAAAQAMAIRIDDHIQASQEGFFDNGTFPSMIITVGKNPTGDQQSGLRPRLSGAQRRQINAAIGKEHGGVVNYGRPAIVDGLIESFDRLSMDSTEMGWDKSEDKVKTRILSAYGVHPFRLGEPMSVGGYAQAAIIDKIFCGNVNTNLDLLGTTINHFTAQADETDGRIVAWWEECTPIDPQLEAQNIREGRKNGDVSQNEFRAFLGLPPDEDNNEDVIGKNGQNVRNMMMDIGNGLVSREQGAAFFRGLGLPDESADALAGVGGPEVTDQQAVEALDAAVAMLGVRPKEVAGRLLEMAK